MADVESGAHRVARVAQAICMKDAGNRVCAERCVDGDMCPYQALAAAAIEAMYEPTAETNAERINLPTCPLAAVEAGR